MRDEQSQADGRKGLEYVKPGERSLSFRSLDSGNQRRCEKGWKDLAGYQ